MHVQQIDLTSFIKYETKNKLYIYLLFDAVQNILEHLKDLVANPSYMALCIRNINMRRI